MDGGDIVFQRFEEGIVYVYMQGACAGCPSSTITLKQGIEACLCEAIAEVKALNRYFNFELEFPYSCGLKTMEK